jgi:hypothetical protein
MGTNYYAHVNICEHCGKPDNVVHIGKSSMGWVFAMHVYPGEPGMPHDWKSWQRFLKREDVVIVDEYGDSISLDKFSRTVTQRTHPNGLQRSTIGEYCSGHGEGTWDYHPHDFC